MKKIVMLIVMIFSFNMILNAECDYTEKVNLITLSSYVDYNYEYMSDNTFKLTFYNVTPEMKLIYNNIEYAPANESVELNSLEEGKSMKVSIKGSDTSECAMLDLRVINLTIPYVNPFYGSNRCIGHESLNVCSNKFLQYKITESEFLRLIDKSENDNKPDDEANDKLVVKELTFFEKVVDFAKKAWIPVLLVILTSGITFGIFSTIYRKVKHGI